MYTYIYISRSTQTFYRGRGGYRGRAEGVRGGDREYEVGSLGSPLIESDRESCVWNSELFEKDY